MEFGMADTKTVIKTIGCGIWLADSHGGEKPIRGAKEVQTSNPWSICNL